MSDGYVPQVNVISRLGAGVVGGVAGGIVLAAILWTLDEVRKYGHLVAQDSLQNSIVVSLFVCGFAGAIFGLFLGKFITGQFVAATGIGLVFGTVWYAVLELVVLQLRGGTVFDMGKNGLLTLGAYVIFGVATAIIYSEFGPRRQYRRYRRRNPDYDVEYVPRLRRRPRRRRRDD